MTARDGPRASAAAALARRGAAVPASPRWPAKRPCCDRKMRTADRTRFQRLHRRAHQVRHAGERRFAETGFAARQLQRADLDRCRKVGMPQAVDRGTRTRVGKAEQTQTRLRARREAAYPRRAQCVAPTARRPRHDQCADAVGMVLCALPAGSSRTTRCPGRTGSRRRLEPNNVPAAMLAWEPRQRPPQTEVTRSVMKLLLRCCCRKNRRCNRSANGITNRTANNRIWCTAVT